VFDSETSKILRAIGEQPQVAALEDKHRRLDVARQNLKTQIVDQRNPGFGELAQEHYADVVKILGVNLTPLRAPDPTAPAEQLAAYANRVGRLHRGASANAVQERSRARVRRPYERTSRR
jgi:hypothetical protein